MNASLIQNFGQSFGEFLFQAAQSYWKQQSNSAGKETGVDAEVRQAKPECSWPTSILGTDHETMRKQIIGALMFL
jgi:hypothetical protein